MDLSTGKTNPKGQTGENNNQSVTEGRVSISHKTGKNPLDVVLLSR